MINGFSSGINQDSAAEEREGYPIICIYVKAGGVEKRLLLYNKKLYARRRYRVPITAAGATARV